MTASTTSTRRGNRRSLRDVVAEIRNDSGHVDPDAVYRVGHQLLDDTLRTLTDRNLPVPVGVQRVLDLSAQLAAQPTGISVLLDALPLDDLTNESVIAIMREHLVAATIADLVAAGAQGKGAPRHTAAGSEVATYLLDRALDALAHGLDDIVGQLRTRWDPAAAVVAAAVTAGITPATTADAAISNAELVEHWRALGPAVATLDDIEVLYQRLLLTTGCPLAAGQPIRHGRATWVGASGTTPLPLVAPSERVVRGQTSGHDQPRTTYGNGHRRSEIAERVA